MKVEVIENTNVLIPNKEHKNFTETKEVISKGIELEGEPKTILGKRRGEDFNYKLFVTKDNRIIYLNKVKPMQTTEVTLGADSTQTPTVVSIPDDKKLLTTNIVISTLIGLGVGYYMSKKQKAEGNSKYVYMGAGALIGFGLGKYIEKRKSIKVKASK